jgi:valyl-tRNA synthetase
MLGDTAVAVNPRDKRYLDLHGKTAMLPLMEREIPIIMDDLADPEFGTGVVKVTPAHDPNDFEAGRRHNLPRLQVIDGDARMTAEAGRYAGLDRYEARRRVVADLESQGLMEKIEDYTLNIGKCDRCKTAVEPLISTQWFVKMKPLAEKAIEVVESGRIEFIPANWTKTYYEWMYNIRDWCISRQLWWGHRIPAWHCQECRDIVVARETPETCARCGSSRLVQDPDVLDTWFSSWLWPFSTLGWPDNTEDLKTFYPTSLLITGFDILFFWVARMVMAGMEFMGEVPFRQVYIHGLVRDAERQKMSKTRGNTIDPLVVTDQYGTDAVRMALLQGAAPGTDIVLTEERMQSSRAFANKIWNAARFLFLNMERAGVDPWVPESLEQFQPEPCADSLEVPLEDRWIFSRLNSCAEQANRAIEQYRYHEAAQVVWHFFWHEFCDWYVELKKLRFQESSGLDAHWRNTLAAFETALRLLHPAMPFITEELWQRLAPGNGNRPVSIALAGYPQYRRNATDYEAEREIGILQGIVTLARTLRTEMKLDPKQQLEGTLFSRSALAVGRKHEEAIQRLANVKLEFSPAAAPKNAAMRSTTEFDLVLHVPQAQEDAQRKRLAKEREQLEKNIANSRRQLADETFLGKAPARVVETIRAKLAEYEAQVGKVNAALDGLAE